MFTELKTLERKTKAFTLIELLVVVAIVALLLSITIPSLQKAKEYARYTVCKTNLKQYGNAVAVYVEENSNAFPCAENSIFWVAKSDPSFYWDPKCWYHDNRCPKDGTLIPYLGDGKVHICPSVQSAMVGKGCRWVGDGHNPEIPFRPHFSYSQNGYLGWYSFKGWWAYGSGHDRPYGGVLKSNEITRSPSNILLFTEESYWPVAEFSQWGLNDTNFLARTPNVLWPCEAPGGNTAAVYPPSNASDAIGTYHLMKGSDQISGRGNVVFVDGHVENAVYNQGWDLAWPLR